MPQYVLLPFWKWGSQQYYNCPITDSIAFKWGVQIPLGLEFAFFPASAKKGELFWLHAFP